MGKVFSCCQKGETARENKSPESSNSNERKPLSSHHTDFPKAAAKGASFLRNPEQNQSVTPPVLDRKCFYSRIPPSVGRSSISSTSSDIKKNNNNSSSAIDSRIHSFFDHYKDETEDLILTEGIESFCFDLQLQPDDFKILVLAWKFGAEYMCKFSRSEFFHGCKSMKIDSIAGIQNKLPEVVTELDDAEVFRDFYKFTFKFGLDHDAGEKTLPVETAVLLWRLVFTNREPELLENWIDFISCQPHVRGIPKDTWLMFLTFSQNVDSDLTNYDESEAWPSIFDDFVEAIRDKINQNTKTLSQNN